MNTNNTSQDPGFSPPPVGDFNLGQQPSASVNFNTNQPIANRGSSETSTEYQLNPNNNNLNAGQNSGFNPVPPASPLENPIAFIEELSRSGGVDNLMVPQILSLLGPKDLLNLVTASENRENGQLVRNAVRSYLVSTLVKPNGETVDPSLPIYELSIPFANNYYITRGYFDKFKQFDKELAYIHQNSDRSKNLSIFLNGIEQDEIKLGVFMAYIKWLMLMGRLRRRIDNSIVINTHNVEDTFESWKYNHLVWFLPKNFNN